MKNIVHRNAGCEARDNRENGLGQQSDDNRLLRKRKNRKLVHYLVDKPRHISFFGLAFFLLIQRSNAFSEVAFPIAMHLRPVFVFAKVRNDIFATDFKIQVQQRNHPHFDQHKAKQAEGYPLFSRISHNIRNEQTGGNGVCGAKVTMNVQKLLKYQNVLPALTNFIVDL
jgi:hypothetical protein